MPTIPTQEVAYTLPVITKSNVNDLFVELVWTEFYNYNADAQTYTGYTLKKVVVPIATINCTVEQNLNSNGDDISSSIVIKNNDITVLSINNNNISIDSEV